MTLVVDTSIFIDHLRGDERARSAFARAWWRGERVTASVLTKLEILAGTRPHEQRPTRGLLAQVEWLAVDDEIAEKGRCARGPLPAQPPWGRGRRLCGRRERRGRPRRALDDQPAPLPDVLEPHVTVRELSLRAPPSRYRAPHRDGVEVDAGDARRLRHVACHGARRRRRGTSELRGGRRRRPGRSPARSTPRARAAS